MSGVQAAFERAAAARVALAAVVQAAQADGLSARQIADEAGVDRALVASILHGGRSLPPVVYLRGRGAQADDWAELEQLLAGVHVTRDRTQAWHLARGGHRVVMCDFTPGVRHAGVPMVRVGVVEAKYDADVDTSAGGEHLALPMVSGGTTARPTRPVPVEGVELPQARLDVPKLAGMVLAHAGVTIGEDDHDDRPGF